MHMTVRIGFQVGKKTTLNKRAYTIDTIVHLHLCMMTERTIMGTELGMALGTVLDMAVGTG